MCACTTAPHVHQHYIAKAIVPCFPQCNYAHDQGKTMPSITRVTAQTRAETAPAPRRTQRLKPLAFVTPFRFIVNTGIRTSLLSNLHIVPRLPHKLQPFDWATSWLSYSIVSYLLVTLPLDCVIQWWVTSWLLYSLTELFKCELPLDYSTTWLSYSIVSCLLITLPLDWAFQLFVTMEISN